MKKSATSGENQQKQSIPELNSQGHPSDVGIIRCQAENIHKTRTETRSKDVLKDWVGSFKHF